MKDYYKILGLSYPATFDEVQSSYWRHYLMPNVGIQNRQARRDELNEAYSVLSKSKHEEAHRKEAFRLRPPKFVHPTRAVKKNAGLCQSLTVVGESSSGNYITPFCLPGHQNCSRSKDIFGKCNEVFCEPARHHS